MHSARSISKETKDRFDFLLKNTLIKQRPKEKNRKSEVPPEVDVSGDVSEYLAKTYDLEKGDSDGSGDTYSLKSNGKSLYPSIVGIGQYNRPVASLQPLA